jgi:hypothetical protein
LGRLNCEVASTRDAEIWRADWTIIVDLLDALHFTQSGDNVRGLYGVATTRA